MSVNQKMKTYFLGKNTILNVSGGGVIMNTPLPHAPDRNIDIITKIHIQNVFHTKCIERKDFKSTFRRLKPHFELFESSLFYFNLWSILLCQLQGPKVSGAFSTTTQIKTIADTILKN